MSTIMEKQRKIEKNVVAGYKSIEDAVVGGYQKIEDKFVKTFLTSDENLEDEKRDNYAAEDKMNA